MQYTQPPAIVEFQKAGYNCTYLRNAQPGSISYIFEMDLDEAQRIFPVASGLERVATIQNATLGNSVLFALYRRHNSTNPWDIAIEYQSATSKPLTMRHAKGGVIYLANKEVYIPEQHDIIFHFDELVRGYDGDFNFGELRNHILNAFYSCNSWERWLLQEEFDKIKSGRYKSKRPELKENHPKINPQGFGHKGFTRQKAPARR